jgi:hypothetical protein
MMVLSISNTLFKPVLSLAFIFPTDNLPSTQLKYDIVASKFMTGIENHHKRNAPSITK